MNRFLLTISMIAIISGLFSIVQMFNSTDKVSFAYASQNEKWLIRYNNEQGTIYDENFVEICAFTFSEAGTKSIYGVGRDFDDDDNIEILYSNTSGPMSVYLKDLTTGEFDLALVGSSQAWYSFPSYFTNELQAHYINSERVFVVQEQNRSTTPYILYFTLYRSGAVSPP